MRAVGHQVRAMCGVRPSAACTPALGRISLRAGPRRRLDVFKMKTGTASSQGRAVCSRLAAAPVGDAAAAAAASTAAAEVAAAAAPAAAKAGANGDFYARLSLLQAFVTLHGRFPRSREKFASIPLGSWVTTQRTAYKQGALKPEQVTALEALPGWTWDPRETKWSFILILLQAFVAQYKRLPKHRETFQGTKLGAWVTTQRMAYKEGKLKPERVSALEAVPGFCFDPWLQAWAAWLKGLIDWAAEARGLLSTRERYKGLALGEWVRRQRAAYKQGRLAPERVTALEAVPEWRWSGR